MLTKNINFKNFSNIKKKKKIKKNFKNLIKNKPLIFKNIKKT